MDKKENRKGTDSIGQMESQELQFPKEPLPYGYTCYDCVYFNPRDRDRYDRPWCDAWRRYLDSTRGCDSRHLNW